MNVLALTDFGSTFTKVTLVEDGSGKLLARSQTPTTVDTDVMEGYFVALEKAERKLSNPFNLVGELAASSAGGGLNMAAVGLVEGLTASAGKQAALNAGAKVGLVISGVIDEKDCIALRTFLPEILLFSGGTDGGQREKVLKNAEIISQVECIRHVVVACNNEIALEVANRFKLAGRTVEVVDNVLPEIDCLVIEPARRMIHEMFISHVIEGKGLSKSKKFGSVVVMPTPEAVLDAVRLLAFGHDNRTQLGGVMVVDLGGATTDVHSAVSTIEQPVFITTTGLPDIPVMRTVQGDLGMRWGAEGVALIDELWLLEVLSSSNIDRSLLINGVQHRQRHPDFLSESDQDQEIDNALAISCMTHALRRHCGSLKTIYRPGQGSEFVQDGIDMREIKFLIGTGGILVNGSNPKALLFSTLARRDAHSLTPQSPEVLIDEDYILVAAGLLATHDSYAAGQLLNKLRSRMGVVCNHDKS